MGRPRCKEWMEKDLLINLLINECHFSSRKGFKAIYENLYNTVITKQRQTYWAWDNVNKSAEWVLAGCPMALAHTSCPRSQAWACPPFSGSGLWGIFSSKESSSLLYLTQGDGFTPGTLSALPELAD